MKTRLVRIGNSQGIRIPKLLIDQAGLSGEVGITVQDDSLVIKPGKKPRAGWTEAFQKMARHGDGVLLDGPPSTMSIWDENEWEW
jgi:antitoxin MazE